jgi:hypothetical protein
MKIICFGIAAVLRKVEDDHDDCVEWTRLPTTGNDVIMFMKVNEEVTHVFEENQLIWVC